MRQMFTTVIVMLSLHLLLWLYLPSYRFGTWFRMPDAVLEAASRIHGTTQTDGTPADREFIVFWLGGFIVLVSSIVIGAFLPKEKA
jgi:hypothetical protein